MGNVINLKVNGLNYSVDVELGETLLDVLREKLDITSPKRGCEMGECGACTVIMNDLAVNSCLVLAIEANNAEIYTVESLKKNGKLHPLQKSFVDNGAIQCGFCTPGMLMSAKALIDRNPDPTEDDIKEAIAGNICRCTGYKPIVEAIKKAVSTMKKEGS
ncbi:MAG: (2Fe-2S)-binding protein [Candidatus Eremiobacteraeota bacterium]|nr:(2Fe-2S)-binding protein [Candidatus Eremiobacteraeota bacterium]